jgi:hypothetical protein
MAGDTAISVVLLEHAARMERFAWIVGIAWLLAMLIITVRFFKGRKP